MSQTRLHLRSPGIGLLDTGSPDDRLYPYWPIHKPSRFETSTTAESIVRWGSRVEMDGVAGQDFAPTAKRVTQRQRISSNARARHIASQTTSSVLSRLNRTHAGRRTRELRRD